VTQLDEEFEILDATSLKTNRSDESFLKFGMHVPTSWYYRFIQLLIELSKENDDRQSSLVYLKNYYKDNPKQLLDISAFEFDYSPSKAVTWYTKDSFVHRKLNEAFRSRDFEFLIRFRFFIADLHQQIYDEFKSPNAPKPPVVYRGQLMHKSEIESLEEEQIICGLSFLSTTLNRDWALNVYAGASKDRSLTDDYQSVLFEIEILRPKSKLLIFADLSKLSFFEDGEEEVLFTTGSHFKISDIRFDNDAGAWIVGLNHAPVRYQTNDLKKPYYIQIITIGFFLYARNDDFQSAQSYYDTLLSIANTLPWIISCHVGIGLVEYYKEKYDLALNKFDQALQLINEHNLHQTLKMIGNIYCLIGNVYREKHEYDTALEWYEKASNVRFYFIEKEHDYWLMFTRTKQINLFVKHDKYFYYCDRPALNKAIVYNRIGQWTSALGNFQTALDTFKELQETGEIEMFVKILQFDSKRGNIIANNHPFLGDKNFSNFPNEIHKTYILEAYIELGKNYLDNNHLDYAFNCYQTIIQYNMKIESAIYVQCLYGIGKVYESKNDYNPAIDWFKKAIDYTIINIVNTEYSTNIFSQLIYENFISISNEKLSNPLSSINYMKEIVEKLIENTTDIEKIIDLISKIYKITIQYYHVNNKTKIELICDHIIGVLSKINLNDRQWIKWICLGSMCSFKVFQTQHYHCQPILDENYKAYLNLYERAADIMANKSGNALKKEIDKCNYFVNNLKVMFLNDQLASLRSND